jgi:hypothetical protein
LRRGERRSLLVHSITNAWFGLPITVVEVVVVGATVVVGAAVVVVGAAVVVEPPPQPSQQLPGPPAVALPPRGARHLSALFLIEHFVFPRRSVRQQVTASGLPQVEWAAQDVTRPLHSFGSADASTSAFAASDTQLTYSPWFAASAQLHCDSAAARAIATAASFVQRSARAAVAIPSAKAPVIRTDMSRAI